MIARGTTSSIIACTDHCGTCSTGAATHCVAVGPRVEPARQRDGDRTHHQRADDRRNPPAERGASAQQQEHQHHRGGHCDVGAEGADEVGAEAQEHAGDHAHHDRHRDEVHDPPHPARQAEDEHQQPGGDERADDLGPREVAERGADEDRARDRPEERQGLAVDPAGQHGEHAVEEEDAEHPRRELGLRQPPWVPTARITATGPVAAKIRPISPFAA